MQTVWPGLAILLNGGELIGLANALAMASSKSARGSIRRDVVGQRLYGPGLQIGATHFRWQLKIQVGFAKRDAVHGCIILHEWVAELESYRNLNIELIGWLEN